MALKLLSYNIREGGEGRLAAIAEILGQQAPDVVAVLEANSRPNVEALARGLGMELAFGAANCASHVAWLSRPPIRRWTNHRHPALAKTLMEIEVTWEGMPLHLFATHLASRHDATEPAREIAILLDLLGLRSGQPHVLSGDFNALRPGDPVGMPPPGVAKRGDAIEGEPRRAIAQLIDAGYVDCYRALHPDTPGYTHPARAPWLRLDYIFASPLLAGRLAACDIVTGSAAGQASDHVPLWAEFR